jgi:tetratricopeptide (TPR) repeat protein
MRSQAAKVSDIVYTRPIFLPFGNYTLELKRQESLEGSQTMVDTVKYRREFTLSAQSPVNEVALTDKDLLFFPATIKTNPSGASVIVESKKYGETPFQGDLPVGNHKLVLRKEGYYDHEQPLSVTMNTPFVTEVALKTSEAGQFINKGKDLVHQAQYPQAIEQLAEALKHNPSPAEIGQVQLALGNAYIKTTAYDVAIGYFEKAKMNPDFKSLADLGISEAAFAAGNKDLALARVIDVMINEKDEKIKSDAETLFHKISPVKSVILVSTEPPGAKVSVNGQDISQPSPLVLSDLSLGSYRISIEKEGFKHYEGRFQLVVSTFKPVIVKLDPAL